MKNIFLFAMFGLFAALELPAQNYPPYTASVFDASATGYYFTCPIRIGTNPGGIPATHTIFDKNGLLVYYRKFPANVNSGDFRLNPNGLISYTVQTRHFMMDSSFTVVDSAFAQDMVIRDGHDIQLLPNGHYLVMGLEILTMDLSSYPYFNQNGSPGSPNAMVRSGVIQELDADKNVVFEWHAADHYEFGDVDPRHLNSPENVDWTHFNAIDIDTDGNILISVRHFNEVTKINRLTGAIMWRFGGKQNQFNFLNDPNQFFGQHDSQRLDNGNIILFDNGRPGLPLHPAGAKEYQLDESAMTANLGWSYFENENVFSRALGNVQRLENGNTLINYGMVSSGNIVFNEVNPAGEKVFELSFEDTLTSYRSYHYSELPWSLKQPEITCYEISGNQFAVAPPGLSKYLWSTGSTNQMIAISTGQTFYVYVSKGQGMIRSKTYKVVNANNFCLKVATDEPAEALPVLVYPNPATDQISLRFSQEEAGTLELFDWSGKLIQTQLLTIPAQFINLDISNLPNGGYLFRLNGQSGKFVKE